MVNMYTDKIGRQYNAVKNVVDGMCTMYRRKEGIECNMTTQRLDLSYG
jgi:hypothetical protein